MELMLFFIVLSIVFVIGTAIYLNHKKKNIAIKQSQNTETKDIGKKINKKQLKNLFNLEIKDDILCINNRYSNIIKLGNIDYNILSTNEQSAIEEVLIETALAIDYPIQFFSTTEYIDTSKIIDLIKKNKSKSAQIHEYQKYLIQYLQTLMENRTISVVKNYAIVSYDGFYKDAVNELPQMSSSLIKNLLKSKIVCEILNEDDIYDLIYRELNKNSALSISALKEGGKNLYVGKKQKRKSKWNWHF